MLRIWSTLAETQFGFHRTMARAQRDGDTIRGDDGHIALRHEDARKQCNHQERCNQPLSGRKK